MPKVEDLKNEKVRRYAEKHGIEAVEELATNLVRVARYKMLNRHPFFGHIALRLRLVVNWSLPTLATDARNIFFNPEFVLTLNKDELIAAVAHEVLHCVLDHVGRGKGKIHAYWNMAIDYLTNYVLVKEGIGKVRPDWLYSPHYNTEEWTSEAVYQDLLKRQPPVVASFDVHLDEDSGDNESEGEGEGGGSGNSDKEGRKAGVPKLPKNIDDVRNEIKAAVVAAAQAVGAGNVPQTLKRFVEELTEPKVDWRELLATVRSISKDDYHPRRLSRKSYVYNLRIPRIYESEKVKVTVFIDASGSIGKKQLMDFLSEVKGIMEAFNDFEVTVASFDTEVHAEKKFTRENLEEIVEFVPVGGGGTDFECIFEHLKKKGDVPDQLVVFTDGYPFGGWGDPDYCKTIWIIHNYGDRVKPPFGEFAYYDEAA